MEQDARESLIQELEYLKGVIESYNDQISRIGRVVDEINLSLSVIGNRKNIEGNETRVSIGYGVYVNARIENFDKLLLPIGSGIYREDSAENVENRLKSELQSLQASMDSLLEKRKDSENRYETLLTVVQQASAQNQKQ
ncbi:MAG: prefoldin subunit alpha [Candidatus Thermoplasmatota archaeon]|nr:prefoldin subunit alpha [Candidatus Thermoplasmatota archaeon]